MKLKKPSIDKEVLSFANSIRGQYIISQALSIAAKHLEDTEPSNSEDMLYLLGLYPMFPKIEVALNEAKEILKEGDKNG